MSCKQQCLRFGELAVKMGFVSHDQLAAALAKQDEENRQNRHRVIGLILYDEGWITTEQIEQVLNRIFLQPDIPGQRPLACEG